MSFNISAAVRGSEDLRKLFQQLRENAPHAARLTSNNLGALLQTEMRSRLGARFRFRKTRPQFENAIVLRLAKPGEDSRVSAELSVGGDSAGAGTATRRLGTLLARYEEPDTRSNTGQIYYDAQHRALTGLGYFLPANQTRTDTSNPPRNRYPANIGASLRLTRTDSLVLSKNQRKTSRRRRGSTFFATRQGIFERVHSAFGRADVRAIWWFKPRISTPARLGLWGTAQRVLTEEGERVALDAIDTVLKRST